ncbi:MAG: hypothetical protein HUU21_01150 [Polyangiaceae bacterium]|nr:hypothetical protein [Polyangiaceae bacterium]
MSTLIADKAASRLVVRTRTSGFLARFAHDLEIVATELSLRASAEGEAWTADISIPVASLRVAGVLKGGDKLDTGVLKASDQAEIENRMQTDVLAGGPEIKVQASGKSRAKGEALVTIGAKSARFPLSQSIETRDGGGVTASGRCDLSLRALGIEEVKGPLGAFRVADTVEIVYTIVLVPGN